MKGGERGGREGGGDEERGGREGREDEERGGGGELTIRREKMKGRLRVVPTPTHAWLLG